MPEDRRLHRVRIYRLAHMELKVGLGERQLAAALARRAEVLCSPNLRLKLGGDLHACPVVEAPVLHELTCNLDGVPLHEVEARRALFADSRQHALEGVAELVVDGLHFPHRKQTLPVVARPLEVCDNYRKGLFAAPVAPVGELVHPRPARLETRPHVGIKVEVRDDLAALADREEPHVFVPDVGALRLGNLLDLDAEEEVRDCEKAVEHGVDLEVALQLLLGIRVGALAQALRLVGDVPGKHRIPADGLFLLLRAGDRRCVEVVDHLEDRHHARRALFRNALLGVVRVAEKPRELPPQGEYLRYAGRVPLRAHGPCAIEDLADLAVGAMLHRLKVCGVVDRVCLAVLLEAKGLCRVDEVVREIRCESRKAGFYLVEPRLLLALKADARHLGGLDHLLEDAPSRRVAAASGLFRHPPEDGLCDFVKPARLADSEGELDHPSLPLFLDVAPLLRIHDAQHVRYAMPAAQEVLHRIVKPPDEVFKTLWA